MKFDVFVAQEYWDRVFALFDRPKLEFAPYTLQSTHPNETVRRRKPDLSSEFLHKHHLAIDCSARFQALTT